MPDFTPTHIWRMSLGSAGFEDIDVALLGDYGDGRRVQTYDGATYLVTRPDELHPIGSTS